MLKDIKATVSLNNGVKMPWLGLGVYKAEGEELINSVKMALKYGYRSFDSAAIYKNEKDMGLGIKEGIQELNIPREEIFVTSKVWNTDQGYETTKKAFEESLSKIGLEYIDLYLIHWPVKNKYKETWKAMEELYKTGKIKAIGVSNFQIYHLQDLLKEAEIVPAINQVEYHPYLTQNDLKEFCNTHNIRLEAWSPLARGKFFNDPTLIKIAKKYNKTTAQIILRWDLQTGVITIPKSVKESRIIENASIFDFELSKEDIDKISKLNQNLRTGPDPDNFDF